MNDEEIAAALGLDRPQLLPAVVGWLVASLTGLVVITLGAAAMAPEPRGTLAALSFFFLAPVVTAPTLLVRACMRFKDGCGWAVVAGTGCAVLLFPVTYSVFEPRGGFSGTEETLMAVVFATAGAAAGFVWWTVEKVARI